MNYDETITWIYSFDKFGIKLGLDRIKILCDKIGNPQNGYKIIHVGGTNGKGSVCRFLQSILTTSGYKTGVYTSPHIQRFSERFIIDFKEISDSDVVILVKKIKPIVEEMIEKGDTPTFFEIVTAMAFLYFKEKNVDFAVVEVGLGGRFDATNIVKPMVSVITNVMLEHQDILGHKVEEIAFEKAGIIKNKIPVITAAKDSALEVIKKVADEKDAPVTIVDNNSWKKIKTNVDGQEFLINGCLKDYKVKTSLLGNHQGENIALSIVVIEKLQMDGIYITDEAITEGIEKTVNPGRMEVLGFKPLFILDGAHNIAGIASLKNSLENDFVYNKLILVMGILSDKNIKEMLEIIVPIADIVITTKSQNKRAAEPVKLKEMIEKLNFKNKVFVKEKVHGAVKHALSIAKKDDLICVTGSLFTVGEARDYLLNKNTKILKTFK
ncbi:MAG: folylpolyglutamate synthase/dihydrofolate synthase family protein [Candidatus Thermoplasmatota archaeon]|jgi:dihydrofolate synthase/folylpolyglutamate synthase|nr:folylpolyglutamate synthase/dihydrofolate synthase family protein [Candidatus Thermoplasmatota archaeon]